MSVIRFSGIASGIDTSSLIDSLISQQRKLQIAPLQNKLSNLQDSNDSLTELKGLLSKLQTAASSLRTVQGGAIAKQATSSNETVASAAVSNAANTGSYSLTVDSTAKAGSVSFNARYTSADAAMLSTIDNADPADDRTLQIALGSGSSAETVSIELTNTTTVSEFVTQFNAATNKAEATLVNTGTRDSPQYAIVIQSKQEGTENGSVVINPSSGVTLSAYASDSTSIAATDASFHIDGIDGTITRSSNTVTDLLPGVSLKLEGTGTTTITISKDLTATTSSVQNFVDAYNDVISYVAENDTVTLKQDGANFVPIFGSLSDVSVDDNLIGSLRSALSGSTASTGLTRTLSDLGITTQRDGTLAFDKTVFAEGIANDSGSSEEVLSHVGDEFGGTASGTVYQYLRYAGLLDNTISQQTSQITSVQNEITDREARISDQEQQLNIKFAALEKVIGQLQSTQNTLAGLLK